MKALKALENRDRTMIVALEKVFGIKNKELNEISGVRKGMYALLRTPGEMRYTVYDYGKCVGYLLIGEDEDGRVILRAETPSGMKVFPYASKEALEHITGFALLALYNAELQAAALAENSEES